MTLRFTARFARLALLLALVGLLASGFALAACGGDGEAADETNEQTTTELPGPSPAGTPREAVEDFLRAVEANDRRLAWALLSTETKTSFELDEQHFAEVLLPALRAELKPGGQPIFSERFGTERALIVLEGVAKGAPFAAALRAEDGGWRIELFYPEFNPTRPAPGERVKAGVREPLTLDIVRRQDKELEVKAWLDGKPLPVTVETKGNFLVTYEATYTVKPGKHTVIAYATTEEGLSGAAAWEFSAR